MATKYRADQSRPGPWPSGGADHGRPRARAAVSPYRISMHRVCLVSPRSSRGPPETPPTIGPPATGVTCAVSHRHHGGEGAEAGDSATRLPKKPHTVVRRRGRSAPTASQRSAATPFTARSAPCRLRRARIEIDTVSRGCQRGGQCTICQVTCAEPLPGCVAPLPGIGDSSPGCAPSPAVPRAPACATSRGGVAIAGPHLCATIACARGPWPPRGQVAEEAWIRWRYIVWERKPVGAELTRCEAEIPDGATLSVCARLRGGAMRYGPVEAGQERRDDAASTGAQPRLVAARLAAAPPGGPEGAHPEAPSPPASGAMSG